MLWFAHGSASYRRTFPPAQSPARSAARNCGVAAPQKRWDRLRVGLDLILGQRGADMADLPGGASGLVRDYKGKEADWLVTPIDPGMVSMVAELRGHEPRGAQGLGVSSAAITLAMIC
jgi:hypothetical protein